MVSLKDIGLPWPTDWPAPKVWVALRTLGILGQMPPNPAEGVVNPHFNRPRGYRTEKQREQVLIAMRVIIKRYDLPRERGFHIWDLAMQEARCIPDFSDRTLRILHQQSDPMHFVMIRALDVIMRTKLKSAAESKTTFAPAGYDLSPARNPSLFGSTVVIFAVDHSNVPAGIADLVSSQKQLACSTNVI